MLTFKLLKRNTFRFATQSCLPILHLTLALFRAPLFLVVSVYFSFAGVSWHHVPVFVVALVRAAHQGTGSHIVLTTHTLVATIVKAFSGVGSFCSSLLVRVETAVSVFSAFHYSWNDKDKVMTHELPLDILSFLTAIWNENCCHA